MASLTDFDLVLHDLDDFQSELNAVTERQNAVTAQLNALAHRFAALRERVNQVVAFKENRVATGVQEKTGSNQHGNVSDANSQADLSDSEVGASKGNIFPDGNLNFKS